MKIRFDRKYLLSQAALMLILLAILVVLPIVFFSENYTPYLENPLNFIILVAVMIATFVAFAFARGAIKISMKRDDKKG